MNNLTRALLLVGGIGAFGAVGCDRYNNDIDKAKIHTQDASSQVINSGSCHSRTEDASNNINGSRDVLRHLANYLITKNFYEGSFSDDEKSHNNDNYVYSLNDLASEEKDFLLSILKELDCEKINFKVEELTIIELSEGESGKTFITLQGSKDGKKMNFDITIDKDGKVALVYKYNSWIDRDVPGSTK